MSRSKQYYVYILASLSRCLYIGVTSRLRQRVGEHRRRRGTAFTGRYAANRLVYFEAFDDPRAAIAREKQIKRWSRAKKMWLIERENPGWLDLAAGWFRSRRRGPSS
jgi:putative endonuclease